VKHNVMFCITICGKACLGHNKLVFCIQAELRQKWKGVLHFQMCSLQVKAMMSTYIIYLISFKSVNWFRKWGLEC